MTVAALTIVGYVRGAAVGLEMDTPSRAETGVSRDGHLARQEAEFYAIANNAFPTLARVSSQADMDLSAERLF